MSSILKVSTLQDPTNSNTALQIDTNGIVTTPARPAFRAVLTAQRNGQNLSTEAAMILDAKEFDIGNNLDLSTSEFTAPVNSIYSFTAVVGISAATTATSVQLMLYKNGAKQVAHTLENISQDPQGGSHISVIHTALLQLVTGDVIKYNFDCNGDSNVNVRNTEFSGFLVG
jgi:hypothetical protein